MMAEKLGGWKPPRVKHDPEIDAAAKERERELLDMKRWDHCHHVAEVPVRVLRLLASGDLDKTTTPMRAVTALSRSQRRVLVLSGPPGTGKSIAACSALWDASAGRYVRADRYAQLARSWDKLDEKIADLVNTSQLLVVDDVGEEPAKERHYIERLLSERYDRDVTTIITTNLDATQFAKAYGMRVISRLQEVGRIVKCEDVLRPGNRQIRLL
jgi:DNA replication protein DnaC